MPTILGKYYPGRRMDDVCRVCRGNPDKVLSKYRCAVCKMCKVDYDKAGLSGEVEEMGYLYLTWLKCKNYNQITTGIAKLDFVLQMTFGSPGPRFRQYHLTKQKVDHDKYVVLRTVNLGRE